MPMEFCRHCHTLLPKSGLGMTIMANLFSTVESFLIFSNVPSKMIPLEITP